MMVVGLVWSNEAWSYAGGSIATGRASHARLVRDEDPHKEAIQSVLQACWGLDVRLTTCSGKNIVMKSKKEGLGSKRAVVPMMMMMMNNQGIVASKFAGSHAYSFYMCGT
jgi:hypothetical protein